MMTTEEEIIDLVMKLMNWDNIKARLWFETPNHMFGGLTPESLVHFGRGHKVLKFIKMKVLYDS